jgi:MinD-like ATPase involved in chromosome partitioning or flagellar assembly
VVGLKIAIGSSKGGTGVSLLARNMAVFFAQVGKRTALVDMSGSLAGLEAFSGMEERTVERSGASSLELRGVLQNLEVFFGVQDAAALWRSLDARLEKGDFEVLVVDVDYDGSAMASRLLRSCPLRLLVTTPEPPSVYETYSCAAALVEDELADRLPDEEGPAALRNRTQHPDWLAGFVSPRDMMEIAGPGEVTDAVMDIVGRMRIGFILNMAQERDDFELPRAIESVGTRLFCLPLVDMGTVERDDAMGAALRKRIPLLVHMPYSKGGRDLESIARRLLATPDVEHVRPRLEVRAPGDEESHYEALEVDRGAGEHEIRRATRRVQEIFGHRTLATVELTRDEPRQEILDRAHEAHRVLLDRRAKRDYDRRLIREEGTSSLLVRPFGERPESPPPGRALRPAPAAPAEPMPEEGARGGWLADVRQRRGITLDELSGISKVSTTYLRAIEQEDFDVLPEPVYVRGFLIAYARTLDLDAEAVARSYLERMRGAT